MNNKNLNNKLKILLTCSVGGHLTDLLNLKSFYSKHDYTFVTFYSQILDKENIGKINLVTDPKRNPMNFIICFFQTFWIFLKGKPDLLISNGAGVAIPSLFIAKIFNTKIIYIECSAIVTQPSWTGRIAYYLSDLFILQWEHLKKYYPKSIYGGLLL